MNHIVRAGLAAVTLCVATVGTAQVAGSTSVMTSTAPVTVRAGTMVAMTPMAEIASSKVKVGDWFEFTVVNDVIENGVVAVPRGSRRSA